MKNAYHEAHRNDFLRKICRVELVPAHMARRTVADVPLYYVRFREAGRHDWVYITGYSAHGYKLSLSDCAARAYSLATASAHLDALLAHASRNRVGVGQT